MELEPQDKPFFVVPDLMLEPLTFTLFLIPVHHSHKYTFSIMQLGKQGTFVQKIGKSILLLHILSEGKLLTGS